MSSSIKSGVGTPAYKDKKKGTERPGIIVAEDVMCVYCNQRAPGGEGVHEHCERMKVIETNQKVIDMNQRAVDSNALLIGEVRKLVEAINHLVSTSSQSSSASTENVPVPAAPSQPSRDPRVHGQQ